MVARFVEAIGDRLPESLGRFIPMKAYSFEDFSQKIKAQGVTDISAIPITEIDSKAPSGFISLLDIADRTFKTAYAGISERGRKVVWVETHEKLINSSITDMNERNMVALRGLITARYRLDCLERKYSVNTILINPKTGESFDKELMRSMNRQAKSLRVHPYPLSPSESK